MIYIEINKKPVAIPEKDNLTVGQLLALRETAGTLIDYISVCSGIDYKTVSNSVIRDENVILSKLGEFFDYTTHKPGKVFWIGSDKYYLKTVGTETIGKRYNIEINGSNYKNESLLCYILAVAISQTDNSEQVAYNYEKILDQKYKDVMPYAFFLLNRFLHGKNKGLNYFEKLRYMTRTVYLKSKLALKI